MTEQKGLRITTLRLIVVGAIVGILISSFAAGVLTGNQVNTKTITLTHVSTSIHTVNSTQYMNSIKTIFTNTTTTTATRTVTSIATLFSIGSNSSLYTTTKKTNSTSVYTTS